jgi:hypothetical protein
MVRQARSVVLLCAVLATAVAAVGAVRLTNPGLTVHEWGTLTSVGGPDGQAMYWQPLSGPQDLPCFVLQQNPSGVQIKGVDVFGLLARLKAGTEKQAPPPPLGSMFAKVRMETPVLYFYAPQEMSVGVKVSFEHGVMSEWYPRAAVPQPNFSQPLATTVGSIEWPSVRILPAARPVYPQDGVKSHYYAARDVDASPLQVGLQFEKFLFYRGLADFQPAITATIEKSGEVSAKVPAGTPRLVLFENHNGHVGYRVAGHAGKHVTLSRPSLDGSIDALRSELEAMLTAQGLYPREAKAMVETWRDSWFEEGTRIFYLMPKSVIDERLPLTVSPAPSEVARVFVGRLELITPEMKDDVERAIVNNDLDALNHYGRFLATVAQQIADRPSISTNPARMFSALQAVAASHPPRPAACQ